MLLDRRWLRSNLVLATINSQSKAGMVICTATNPLLAAARTSCSQLEIVSHTQMSSCKHLYSSLVVATGKMTTLIQYAASSTSGMLFIVRFITNAHFLAFRALATAIIASPLVQFSAIFIRVSPMSTGEGVLMIIAATAALGPATGIEISVTTAASGFPRSVVGVAAQCCSVCNSVGCPLVCRFTLGVSAFHIHRIHGLSLIIL